MESSVMQAFEKTNPSDQFEKFLVQMSIRLYWMERMLSGDEAGHSHPYASVVPEPKAKVAEEGGKFVWLSQLAVRFSIPAAVILGA
ncbi:MAG: hypothetical protein EOP85_12585, partial [Verrucomicrobiaceae bacterium]